MSKKPKNMYTYKEFFENVRGGHHPCTFFLSMLDLTEFVLFPKEPIFDETDDYVDVHNK